MGNASFKLLYGCVVSVCCVDFMSLDVVLDKLLIVPGMLVCSSFLICVCMFIVLKAHIECYSDCSRRARPLV